MAIKTEGVTRASEGRRKEQGQYWVYLDGEVKRYADAKVGLCNTGPGSSRASGATGAPSTSSSSSSSYGSTTAGCRTPSSC